MSGGPRDRGSATLWALALATVLLSAGAAGLALAQVAAAHQRVDAAADLAALAGAERVLLGADQACARAAELAEHEHVTLESCTVADLEVLVGVRIPAPGLVVRAFEAVGASDPVVRASARAAPWQLDQDRPPPQDR